MLIKFNALIPGDEFIISAYSGLRYLSAVRRTKNGTLVCTAYKNHKGYTLCETDVDLHNTVIYLRDGHDIWLVRRDS